MDTAGQGDLLSWRPGRRKKQRAPSEWKIISVREVAPPESMPICATPQAAVNYWNAYIATAPHFQPDVECFAVLLLNTRYRVRGHQIVSTGSLNESVVHPREAFRAAVIAAAHSIVAMHNHPSGETEPSQADISVTRILVHAGKILRIELLDHIIVGHRRYYSFRESGHI